MASDSKLLCALLSHLTLPPRLPPGHDVDDAVLGPALIDLATRSVRILQKLILPLGKRYGSVLEALSVARALQSCGTLSKAALLEQFESLANDSSNVFLFFAIPAQNAGPLIWKRHECVK